MGEKQYDIIFRDGPKTALSFLNHTSRSLRPIGVLFSVLLPIAYIWCLPFLSSWKIKRKIGEVHNKSTTINFAENGCYNGIEDKCGLGHSISAYISNPQATGAMAFTFALPIIVMWKYKPDGINTFPLLLFTIFFGLFLICSLTLNIYAHIFTLLVFCFASIIHFSFFYDKLSNKKKIFRILIILAKLSLLLLSALCAYFIIKRNNPSNNKLVDTHWVWLIECIGLTSFILFTPLYLIYK